MARETIGACDRGRTPGTTSVLLSLCTDCYDSLSRFRAAVRSLCNSSRLASTTNDEARGVLATAEDIKTLWGA